MAAANKKGGYDAVFVKSLVEETKYECPMCTFVLRDPVQTRGCGHRFCKDCFKELCKRYLAFCQVLIIAFPKFAMNIGKA